MAEVTYAFGTVPPDERQKRIISIVEGALELAMSGRLRAIAFVAIDDVGDPHSNYSAERWMELIGGVERLRWHINKDIDMLSVEDNVSDGGDAA